MTECWSEGELRAYLDRELLPEDQARVALHLAECDECGRLLAELDARAQRVGALVGSLDVAGAPAGAGARHHSRRRWVAAGLALAAGLAIGAVVWKHPAPPSIPASPSAPAPPVALAAVEPAPAAEAVAARAPVRRPEGRVRQRFAADGFVRLDDEPFETGLVVRMALGPGGVPADVVFSPDGRPRAVRLVSFK